MSAQLFVAHQGGAGCLRRVAVPRSQRRRCQLLCRAHWYVDRGCWGMEVDTHPTHLLVPTPAPARSPTPTAPTGKKDSVAYTLPSRSVVFQAFREIVVPKTVDVREGHHHRTPSQSERPGPPSRSPSPSQRAGGLSRGASRGAGSDEGIATYRCEQVTFPARVRLRSEQCR